MKPEAPIAYVQNINIIIANQTALKIPIIIADCEVETIAQWYCGLKVRGALFPYCHVAGARHAGGSVPPPVSNCSLPASLVISPDSYSAAS